MDLWESLNTKEIYRQLDEYFEVDVPVRQENSPAPDRSDFPVAFAVPLQEADDEDGDDYFSQIMGLLNPRKGEPTQGAAKRETPPLDPAEWAEWEAFFKEQETSSFAEQLLFRIDANGWTDAQVYKRAWIDRRLFSKLRSQPDYRPSKPTVLALVLAVWPTREEAETLLQAAGYSFSGHDSTDLAVLYCIEHNIYDLTKVNGALEYLGQAPLGAKEG